MQMVTIDQDAPKIFYCDKRLSMQSEDMARFFKKDHCEIIDLIEGLPISKDFMKLNIPRVDWYKHYGYTIFAEGFAMIAIFLEEKFCQGELSKDDEDYEFSIDFLIEKLKRAFSSKQEKFKQAA